MGYIGQTPSAVPLDGSDIADDIVDSQHYAAGSIDTAHLADDQITLAKMAAGTDGNIISYDASGNPVAIATGSDGQVLTSAGAGAPPTFSAAPAHTGNVAFPATQSASGDANTLDDYEEGSWTPVIGGATNESGQSYSVQSGTYLKIGNTVIVYAKALATTIGTVNGSVRVKGLPFTVSSDASVNGSGSVPDWFNLNATKVFVGCAPIAGTTQLGMRSLASAAVSSTSMANSDVINNTEIKVNAIYHI